MKKARIEYHLHAVIERLGDFAEDFDDARSGHPIERRLKRIERVAEGGHGKLVDRFDYGIRVVFDSADDAVLAAAVAEEEYALGDTGRILLRPSGTESLVRVMVEAPTQETAQGVADRLAAVVLQQLAL